MLLGCARGYFETLTRVWLVLVSDACRRTGALTSTALLTSCPELIARQRESPVSTKHNSGYRGIDRAQACRPTYDDPAEAR